MNKLNVAEVISVPHKQEVKSLEDFKIFFSITNVSELNIMGRRTQYKTLTFPDFLKMNIEERPINSNYNLTRTAVIQKEGSAKFHFNKYTDSEFEEYNQNWETINETTIFDLFSYLSSTNSRIIFNPSYYNVNTGGVNFDLFQPNFEESTINANDLVISNKKFNIVLNGIIRGNVNDGSISTEVTRYHPFKIIKQGKPVHEYIDVILNEKNNLIEEHGKRVSENVVRVYLDKITLYKSSYYNVDTLTSFKITHMHLKGEIKGITKALEHMKNKLKENGVFNKSIWYRGEPLDDEYISDLGSNTLDIWLKGKNKIISLEKLFSELELLGGNLQNICMKLATKEEVVDFGGFLEDGLILVNELFKAGSINEFEHSMLEKYLTSCTIHGNTLLERYENLQTLYRAKNSELNDIELLLMLARYDINKKNEVQGDKISSVILGIEGNKVGISRGTSSYKSHLFPDYIISIKRGKVTEPFKPATDTSQWGESVFISEDIKGL